MRISVFVITMLVLAGCASAPRHHGGFGGAGAAYGPRYQRAERAGPAAGSADADAILFASFDTDGDLLISATELETGIAREFARADANHDHVVSPDEYQAWSLRALGGAFPPYRLDVDRNADGQITFEEFAAEFRARAHRYDSNGDGVIEHTDLVHQQASDDDLQLLTSQGAGAGDAGDDSRPRRRR